MSQTTLRNEAVNLLHLLKGVFADLRSYAAANGSPDVARLSVRLEPLLAAFETAVLVDRDRSAAAVSGMPTRS